MRTRQFAIALAAICAIGGSSRASDTCPAGVAPAQSPPSLIPNPHVIDVYWNVSFWSSAVWQRSAIDGGWADMANKPDFWARLVEYGVGVGGYYGSFLLDPAIGNESAGSYLDESAIRGTLGDEIETGQLGPWNDNNLYVIYLPPNVGSAYDADGGYIGHHDSFQDSGGRNVRYAIVEFGSTDIQTATASHEIVEAATDPDTTWWGGATGWVDPHGNEIADLCSATFYWDGVSIQSIWSEESCTCITFKQPTKVDPCQKLPPQQRLCCKKPWLPMCSDGS